jgi:hypothetical protein
MFEVKFIEGEDLTPDPSGGATEIFRPVADVGNFNWAPEPLWPNIDEVTPSDVDYISGSVEPCTAVVTLSAPVTPFVGVVTAGKFRIRLKFEGDDPEVGPEGWYIGLQFNGGSEIAFVGLFDSGANGVFTTLEFDFITETSYAGQSFDWSDLQFQLSGPNLFGLTTTLFISWVEVELTHA